MEAKQVVMLFGVLLIIGGVILMTITEEAGESGTEVTPSAEASEEIHPYFWHGLVLIVAGIIIVMVAVFKML
ncbi:MAG: hypothetical protein KGY76_08780 [Candidatus Thermoplasmatota archaeon]|nr:hypothetical protein [Candidatus Thermoplasmatota archaeon]